MLTLAITKSVGLSDLSTSTVQALSEKKEALTQKVDALRAELQALNRAHATTIASFQVEKKKLNVGLLDQRKKNAALERQNNELSKTITRYQTELTAHQCAKPCLLTAMIVNGARDMCRKYGDSIEVFVRLLRYPNL